MASVEQREIDNYSSYKTALTHAEDSAGGAEGSIGFDEAHASANYSLCQGIRLNQVTNHSIETHPNDDQRWEIVASLQTLNQ